MRKSKLNRKSTSDVILDVVVYTIMICVFAFTLYPFYYSVILSFNDGMDAIKGGIYFFPRKFTLDNYRAVISIDYIYTAMFITVLRTAIGTFSSLLFTALFAYSIAHKDLMFRKFYVIVLMITMYFSGGLIPYYMLLKQIGLMNKFAVYIVPLLLNAFNAIIMMTFFREIPDALEDAAKIDGASHVRMFFQIILPVSTPMLATLALFIGVGHWNAWTDAAFFITNKNLKTLGYVLISLINQTEAAARLQETGAMGTMNLSSSKITAETLRPAAMLIAVVPIIMVYPFLQKYFVKGIMIGSIK